MADFDLCVGLGPMSKTANDVEITTRKHPDDGSKHQAVVSDKVHQRSWSGEGKSCDEATTEAVRKFLGDRRAGEYVKR